MESKTIGNKIAEARKKVNISQAELARRLFISPQAVGKWERGESMPDIITLNRLAEILGTDLNYFSDKTETSNAKTASGLPEKQTDDMPLTGQEKKLNWDMSSGNWADADFSGLKNLHEKFSGSNMQGCKFIGSDLSGLLLKGNNVERCDFSRSNLSKCRLEKSHLLHDIFQESLLMEAGFTGSHINGCDFSGTNLSGTEFSGSYIYDCDLTGADFTGVTVKSGGFEKNIGPDTVWNRTSFVSSSIINTVFEGNLDDCYFENCSFKNVTFQKATLTNTFFKCKSLKRIRFIDSRADRMTYEFLKSGKADMSGITLLTQKEGTDDAK